MKEVKIKDICEKGSSNLKQKDVENKNGSYPVFGASGLIGHSDTYHQENSYIAIVKDGSGIGRVTFMPPQSSVIGTMQYILPKTDYDIKYIGYCLQSLDLSKYKQGAAIPHIYFRDYGERLVKVVDSLSEQKEIVEYLDSSFAKIDKLKENAAKNLEEAKALFQSALKDALESKKGWEYKALKDICTQLFAGGDVPKPNVSKKATTDFYIPIYSNGVENEGLYGYTDDARVNEPAVTISARGTIGALFRRYKPFFPAIRLITAVPNKDLLSVEFLFYTLKVFTVRNSGTSIPQLTIPNIKKVTIPIPPLSEQQEIVSRLDSLNENVKKLQQNYSRICSECDALKQSILRQVFE